MNIFELVPVGVIYSPSHKQDDTPHPGRQSPGTSEIEILPVYAEGLKDIVEAKQLTDDDVILALAGIPENNKHCSPMGRIMQTVAGIFHKIILLFLPSQGCFCSIRHSLFRNGQASQ